MLVNVRVSCSGSHVSKIVISVSFSLNILEILVCVGNGGGLVPTVSQAPNDGDSFTSVIFSTLVDQMKMFGETFIIGCSEEQIQMSAESQETGKMSVNVPIDDMNSYAIDEGETLNMSFSLNHLKNICLYSKISKEIDIYLKSQYPIKIAYTLDSENAKAIFYLAPKIDD